MHTDTADVEIPPGRAEGMLDTLTKLTLTLDRPKLRPEGEARLREASQRD